MCPKVEILVFIETNKYLQCRGTSLYTHRIPLGPQKSQNMFTTALFLKPNPWDHPVFRSDTLIIIKQAAPGVVPIAHGPWKTPEHTCLAGPPLCRKLYHKHGSQAPFSSENSNMNKPLNSLLV